jgi:hypothetical protein
MPFVFQEKRYYFGVGHDRSGQEYAVVFATRSEVTAEKIARAIEMDVREIPPGHFDGPWSALDRTGFSTVDNTDGERGGSLPALLKTHFSRYVSGEKC